MYKPETISETIHTAAIRPGPAIRTQFGQFGQDPKGLWYLN
jgi:hypothetical protein